jgi:hypothetical protein
MRANRALPNRAGDTPLDLARERGFRDIVELLRR